MKRPPRTGRRGFSVLESLAALGLLSVALVLMAQVSMWSLSEQRRSAVRHEALEAAANVLEAARATPWEKLTPEWAAAQKLSEPLAHRLPQGRLTVHVEPETSRLQTKRVSVEIAWQLDGALPAHPVVLVGLFSARSAQKSGG